MKFTHYKLGHMTRGQIVEVSLSGSAANVRLMNSSNFSSFKAGRRHSYHGGLAKKSPIRLQIPSGGQWHITVDMQGLRGTVRSSIRTLPSSLPDITERSLAEVPSLIRSPVDDGDKTYDVFISHASEDKESFVAPFADALRSKGLTVWYDVFEMRIGDSLRQKIDKGLATSRFGIVVFSPDFFRKGWTNYELDGIVSRSINDEQVLLPIWHNVTKQDVLDFSPSLADKVARSTGSYTSHEIAEEIADLIKG